MNDVYYQLKTKGKVSRGWLGVYIQEIDDKLAKSFGMKKSKGALVSKVLPNSPAEKAKIQQGDVILKLVIMRSVIIKERSMTQERRSLVLMLITTLKSSLFTAVGCLSRSSCTSIVGNHCPVCIVRK